ncbi:hypothetical protein Rsub_07699 [Raphidocelis subcapitata]|uniref:CID domain-containing protein n=1 Tax=Raphidocelis subcapitata TaxID=307507 RepID=A0A2V0PDE1_9CHLO|nr:hypothetical protein Rsub_07699 [Raphidocelis subcapitata]|eukprot:GBF95115.1 hypothetical protein Rsub_07699 [Raphidocelis subcapitata]
MDSAEFVAEYRDLLAQLKRNEKRDINVLSMLAEDNKQHAPAIVRAIEKHILVAPAPVKLPALYVLDSIVKNVREPYKSLFSRGLPEVFGSVWDSTLPDRRGPLSRLFATWGGVFAPEVLERVKERMVSAAPPPMQQQFPGPAPMQQVLQLPAGAAYGVPPGQLTTVVSLAPPVQLQLGPMQLPHYAPPTMQFQPPSGMLPPSPQHGGWPQHQHHQQQQQQQQQMPFDPRLRRSRSPYGGPEQQQQQPLAPGQLSSLLSSLAQTGILKAPAAAAAWTDDPALRTTELAPAFIKEQHEGVIAALAQVSEQTRGAFLDLAFLRKQRQLGGGALSRSWYVTIDHWLAGTVAATETAQAFGGEEEEGGKEEEPPPLEPEDPTQPCCAISGEPFEKVYDQEREGWFFKGARRLAGDEAAAHGVPEGALVKVSALAEAAGGPGSDAAGGGVLDASGLAADLAAAAAAAGAEGGPALPQQQPQPQPQLPAAPAAEWEAKQGAVKSEHEAKAGVKREADGGTPEGKRQRAA